MEKVGKTWPSGPERTLFTRAEPYFPKFDNP